MIDYSLFKRDNRWKYLHDKARENRQIAHNARFYVTCNRNPWEGVLFKTRSNKQVQATKAFLERCWGRTWQPKA